MSKLKLNDSDFAEAAKLLNCEVAAIKAVAEVESGSMGGFCPDDFPVTLFEGHIFHKYTNGQFDSEYPTLSYPKWTTQFYGHNWQENRERLESAVKLDRRAALMSSSWGKFQIMGFNFPVVGCLSVQQFINKMCKSESSQLNLFCQYIIHECLDDELRDHRWDDFARRYNGPLYIKNDYAGKIDRAYSKFNQGGKV